MHVECCVGASAQLHRGSRRRAHDRTASTHRGGVCRTSQRTMPAVISSRAGKVRWVCRCCVRTCVCTNVSVCVRTCVCTSVCVCACVRACACLCVRNCACACGMRAAVGTHIGGWAALGLRRYCCDRHELLGAHCSGNGCSHIRTGTAHIRTGTAPYLFMTGCFDAMHATQLHLVVAPPSAFRNSAPSRKAGGSCMLRPSGVNTE
jgi:hypothetical protein